MCPVIELSMLFIIKLAKRAIIYVKSSDFRVFFAVFTWPTIDFWPRPDRSLIPVRFWFGALNFREVLFSNLLINYRCVVFDSDWKCGDKNSNSYFKLSDCCYRAVERLLSPNQDRPPFSFEIRNVSTKPYHLFLSLLSCRRRSRRKTIITIRALMQIFGRDTKWAEHQCVYDCPWSKTFDSSFSSLISGVRFVNISNFVFAQPAKRRKV